MTVIVRNRATRELIGQDIVLAQNFWQKFVGLMGTRSLTPGAGMLFPSFANNPKQIPLIVDLGGF